MIKYIFDISPPTSELAHACGHCVTCLALPQVDANINVLFHYRAQLAWAFGEEMVFA